VLSAPTRASWALLAPGYAVTLFAMWRAGSPDSWGWWLHAAPFALWAFAPYALFGLASARMARSRAASAVMLVACALLSVVTAWLLRDAFVANLDAQSGIVFVFLPIWQAIALAPFLGAAVWLRGRDDRPRLNS
jgi:hypothetical protein